MIQQPIGLYTSLNHDDSEHHLHVRQALVERIAPTLG
jgi:hypothetical protein